MIIEYSIGELKYYYSGNHEYGDYTREDINNIHILEDILTDTIDNDYINNNIYHIFPSAVAITVAAAIIAITL